MEPHHAASFTDVLFNFKDNLANWLIFAAVCVFGWMKAMPGVFNNRREKIENAIEESRRTKNEGARFLEEQRSRIGNAEREAEQILVEAKRVAEEMKQQIAEQTKKDAVDLERKLEQQILTYRQMVITELRSTAATVAVRIAERELPGAITSNVKQGLQDRFVSQLDAIGSSK